MPSPGEALDIRYVRNGDVSIAYQVVGDGPTDLVLVPDFFSNLVYDWEAPHWRRVLRTARAVVPADPVRQARHGPLGPRTARSEPRDADGRRARGARRSRLASARSSSAVTRAATMACLYAATYPERTVGSRPVAGGRRSNADSSPTSSRNCSACGTDGEPSSTRRDARGDLPDPRRESGRPRVVREQDARRSEPRGGVRAEPACGPRPTSGHPPGDSRADARHRRGDLGEADAARSSSESATPRVRISG